jgi:hypothetical protein
MGVAPEAIVKKTFFKYRLRSICSLLFSFLHILHKNFFPFIFVGYAINASDRSSPRCRGNLETVAMGMAYRRGSTVCDDGSGSGLCQLRHLGLPRFKALHVGGNTPTSCLAFYYLHNGYNAPRAVRSRGGRRRWIGSPRLRVQTPLYRQGFGYRLGGRLPSCRLLRGCVFSVILWPALTVATL